MTRYRADEPIIDGDLLQLRAPVRDFLGRYEGDRDVVEDLTQETLLRVWEVRSRVDRAGAHDYALATARNLLRSRQRRQQVHDRHAHRLHDPRPDGLPEEAALRAEEQEAAAAAVRALDPTDRELLGSHYEPAGPPRGPRPAGMTARLARARSRARVDYLLALRRVELPTPRCRSVLEALSTGDRRLQERVGVERHLAACPVCTGCAPALLGRRRVLFGLLPLPLALGGQAVHRAVASRPRTASVGTAVALAGVATALVLTQGGPAPDRSPAAALAAPAVPAVRSGAPSAGALSTGVTGGPATGGPPTGGTAPAGTQPAGTQPAGTVTIGDGSVLLPATDAVPLRDRIGQPVVARSVRVLSVPADEGFWVGNAQQRMWVQLGTTGESGPTVRPGQLVSFTGTVASTRAGVPGGLTPAEGRGDLLDEGAYLAVPVTGLRQR